MKVIPAIDLRHGRVVQLVGGDPNREDFVADQTPIEIARKWIADGASWLHVINLDGALDGPAAQPAQRDAIAALLGIRDVPVQFGGGLRTTDAVDAAIAAGARRVIVGTRAVTDPNWRRAMAARHPDAIVLAVDGKDGKVLVDGWKTETSIDVVALAADAAKEGIAAILYTDVGVEGRMVGPNLETTRQLVATGLPIIASGGIGAPEHLTQLRDVGAWGVVVGMALYTGRIALGDLS